MRSNPTTSCVLLKLKCTFVSLCLAIASINASPSFAQEKDIDIAVPTIIQIQKLVGESGQSHTIVATVIDDYEVKHVTLYYRYGQAEKYTAELMQPTANDHYEATVPTEGKNAQTLEYYIETADVSGNSTFRGYAFNPMTLQLTPDVSGQSNTDAVATASPEAVETKTIESNPVQKSGSKNRTLYTVLGVLAAVVVVGSVSAVGSGGGSGSTDSGTKTLTFTVPVPGAN